MSTPRDGFFVKTLRAIEAWMDDDHGVDLIGVGKSFFVVGTACVALVAALALPMIYFATRSEANAESQCINGGGAWGIVGYHHSVKPIGTFPDYGCILLDHVVQRP